jgi:uncharacterized tellurite resistance protein B-like protein
MNAMCCVMSVDGNATQKEREAIHTILKNTKAPWTKEDVDKRIDGFLELVKSDGREKIIQTTCSNLPEFKRRKKQEVLMACLDFMARADGTMDESKIKVIEKFKFAIESKSNKSNAKVAGVEGVIAILSAPGDVCLIHLAAGYALPRFSILAARFSLFVEHRVAK